MAVWVKVSYGHPWREKWVNLEQAISVVCGDDGIWCAEFGGGLADYIRLDSDPRPLMGDAARHPTATEEKS